MKLIKRESYLATLSSMKDQNLIKVLTGIRRCGKSTILKMFKDRLLEDGVDETQIISLSFEDPNLSTKSYQDIYNLIIDQLSPDCMNYIFLDEVQLIKEFERLLLGLQAKQNVDLYVTGSNAYLMSSEMATLLSGRSFEIKVYPFSFKEYVEAIDAESEEKHSLEEHFQNYLLYGGMPQAIATYLSDPKLVDQYISGVYETVIGRDIMDRGKVENRAVLDRIAKYIFENISTQNIMNTLNSDGVQKSFHTISNNITALRDSFLIYEANRLHIKGREILKTQQKYYVVDTGLRSALLGREANVDTGHLLENVIYFELLRRNKNVWIGKNKNSEIDFVTQDKKGLTTYYQVALTTENEDTLERELTPLKEIKDFSPRYLITTDFDEPTYNGIQKVNAYKWLLDE